MQFQADIMDGRICRPQVRETTALGAACLAGLAVGFWKGLDEIKSRWKIDQVFEPAIPEEKRKALLSGWHKAVGRSRDWAE
jgi:glycerol kinase